MPGCFGSGINGKDYCYSATTINPTPITLHPTSPPPTTPDPVIPTNPPPTNPPSTTPAPVAPTPSSSKPLQEDGDNGSPLPAFPLPECSGDCDNDSQCFGDLVCFKRNGTQSVPGCTGTGVSAKDYCHKPNEADTLAYVGNDLLPSRSFPLGECEGDCDSDDDCAGSLQCIERSGTESVPGCFGSGCSGKDFCYRDTPPTNPTTPAPVTPSPYVPGELAVFKEGLRLSEGLDVRKIATKRQRVQFATGGQSLINFHTAPDGAAVFSKNDGSGNYYYVSNSESSRSGGVGSIEFDSNGHILGYQRVLSDTNRNCGGGRSPYNTWLTCEEDGSNGHVWEVSPSGEFVGKQTNLVLDGGNYESVAYHFDATLGLNVYYTTEDSADGALVQFIPSANLGTAEEMYSPGTHRYLRVDSGNLGSFSWVSSKRDATPSLYPHAEGIDIKNDVLYFVSKVDRTLFILNLAGGCSGSFTKESTKHGAVSYQCILHSTLLVANESSLTIAFFFCAVQQPSRPSWSHYWH